MGKDAEVDLVGIDTHRPQGVGAVQAVLLLAVVVIPGRTLGVGQACVDHDLVLAGIDVKAQHRDLDLVPGLAFEKHVGAQVGLAPTGIDGIDFVLR